jgi:hypothetical protein
MHEQLNVDFIILVNNFKKDDRIEVKFDPLIIKILYYQLI